MGAEYYPHKCYLASKLKRRRIELEIKYSESAAKCHDFHEFLTERQPDF